MPDFWASSNFALLERDGGRLRVTDDYLRAFYLRPELAPIAESGDAERALHDALMQEPRRPLSDADIDAVADEDARENYRIMRRFRENLLAHPTLEAFYFDLFRREVAVPPAFVHEIAQVILRGVLDGTENGLEARAGELFFREQRVAIEHGSVVLADSETVAAQAGYSGLGNMGQLLKEMQAPVKSAELDVLDEINHSEYFRRDERHDTALMVNPGQPGSHALARVFERWIAHFHGVETKVAPVREIPDDEWRWHVGLDAEATALLNAIYNGGDVEEESMKRVIGLYRVDFKDASAVLPELEGFPVFLGLAMTPHATFRMKPQNLLLNLPLARRA